MGTAHQRLGTLAVLLACAAAVTAQTRALPPDKVPDDFPKNCPIFANSTIRDYVPAMKNRVKVGNILVLETTGSEADLIAFYKQALPANGWTLLKHPKHETDLLEAVKESRHVILDIVATHQGPNPTTTYSLFASLK
jgi:hypothetical protein